MSETITMDMIARTDVRDVVEGMELVTKLGVAEVTRIGFANPYHRCGWKFYMSDGEVMEFGFHNEKVIRILPEFVELTRKVCSK